jgi:predicted choloylglycine hydrolase
MRKRFVFRREERPGGAWRARFDAGRDEAERWYRGEGLTDPPTAAKCRAALREHMPELLPHYDHVCSLVGDDDVAHRILSHYRPPPLLSGCSQEVWLGKEGPALVRNYDFPLSVVSDGFESTSWSGREVISKAQRPWGGCLDGMNQDGLVASLTFGGSPAQGPGFSIILLLRYVLETCDRVETAVAALCRIPVALSQNVVLLDRSGAHATLFLGPNRAPAVTRALVCTNHQESVVWPEAAAENLTLERQRVLQEALKDPQMTLAKLGACLLEPPLYSRRQRSPTAYTAIYRPAEGRVDYLWPGAYRRREIGRFEAGEYIHDYGDLVS